MRLAPLFLTTVICAWLFLAALAWTFVNVFSGREPRFTILGAGLVGGSLGVAAAEFAGRQGLLSLLLSFPFAFLGSLLVCAGLAARQARAGSPDAGCED
jgi:endonuclease/exonuclease/phosphatase (EEP) superfamily protein YafD